MADGDTRYQAQRLALSRALALAGISVTLSIPIAFYARAASPDTTMVPLVDPTGRGFYLACVVVVALIATITQVLETDDPARIVNRYGERLYQFRQPVPRTAWMLPAVAIAGLYLLVAHQPRMLVVVLVPFAAGAVMLAARMLRFEVLNHHAASIQAIRFAQQALVYCVAFGALLAVVAFRARILFSGPVLFLLSFLLLMSLFDGTEAPGSRRVVHAFAGAAGVTQVAWALGFWNVTTPVAAVLLLLVFAFAGSLSRAHLSGGVSRQRVVAHAGAFAPLFLLLALSVE